MLPGSTQPRKARDRGGRVDGRTTASSPPCCGWPAPASAGCTRCKRRRWAAPGPSPDPGRAAGGL